MTDQAGPDDEETDPTAREHGESVDLLDPETRAAFERSFERHKKALERLAEL